MQERLKHLVDSKGQTLIETLAAIFILVMGITSAVGLATYAFGSSTTVTKQIIATGLAREGLEAVKNMRDTNWLAQTTIDTDCYSFASSTGSYADCYKQWLTNSSSTVPTYCINPSSAGTCDGAASTTNYSIGFNWSVPNFYTLHPQIACGNNCDYGLVFDPTFAHPGGFYDTGSVLIRCADGATDGSLLISDYCRKIIITKITTPPYDQNTGPLLFVQSQVWWVDKKCPRSGDWPGLGKCSVELDTYLTNWKDY